MQNKQKRDKELGLVIVRFAMVLSVVLLVGMYAIDHVHQEHKDAGLAFFIAIFLLLLTGLFVYGYSILKKYAK